MDEPLDPLQRAASREVALGCLCQKARNAARAVTRFYDRHFEGSAIEPPQFNILVAISLAQPVSMVPLAGHLGLDRTTLTRNLGILLRDGLVAETRGGVDARQRFLSLTAAGRRMLQDAMPRWRRAQEAAISALGSADFARLSDSLSLLAKLNPTTKDNTHENQ